MRAWLRAAWHLPRRAPGFDPWEPRERIIRRLAPGRSFIDVGGMWSVHGRSAFLAEEAGADRIVLMDAMEPTGEFEAEQARRGSRVEYVRGDLNDVEAMKAVGQFDVVWCTGVLYHTPHPVLQIENLRRMVRDHLVLGTRVIPEVPGLEHACIFYPFQSENAQREFARGIGDDAPRTGFTSPFDPTQVDANWWWGMSPSAVRAMLAVAGLRVVEEHAPTPFMADFVAEPA